MIRILVGLLISIILLTSCKASAGHSKADFEAIPELSIKSQFTKSSVDFNAKQNEIFDLVKKSAETPVFADRFKIFNAGYITILDENKKPTVGITIKSDGNTITVEKGYDLNVEPFAAIQITEANAKKMWEIFSDNNISDSETFLITNLFFKPLLERIIASREIRYFTKAGKVKHPDVISYILKNPLNIQLPPDEDWTKLTVYKDHDVFKVKNGQEASAKAVYAFDSGSIWSIFTKTIDMMNETDFDLKAKKFDEVQNKLLTLNISK